MSPARPPILRRFAGLLRPQAARMGLGTGLGWLAVTASVGLLALAGWFISAAAAAALAPATVHLFNFFPPSGGVRIFAITRTLARYAERLATHDTAFRLLAALRVWFYRRIEPLAPARLMAQRSGDVLNRIVADIDALDNLYVRVLSPVAVAAATILSVVLFLAVFDGAIALASLAFLLLAGVTLPLAAAGAGARPGRRLTRRVAALRLDVIDAVQGLAELIVYDAWERRRAALVAANRRLVRTQAAMSRIRGITMAATTLLAGLAVLVCLYLGVERVARGELHGANLALVGLAVLAAFEAVQPLPGAFLHLGQTREAGRRLLELVDAPPPVAFPESSHAAPQCFDLHLDGLRFRYRETGPWVLDDVRCHIRQNRRVAVVGATGAGKSTLFHLLARFWDPQEGALRIGGCDLRSLAEADLRRLMGVVPQQAHLFTATIRDNLLLARPAADDAALRAALDRARVLDVVEDLPDGLDTWIGEGGRTLSGGQARRLTLARIFLQDPPIWLLDEPTEGLDRITARRVMTALFEATRQRTLIVVTHHLEDLHRYDEILRIERGRCWVEKPPEV